MKALTVEPGRPRSLRLEDVPSPDVDADHDVIVDGVAVGVCGTDREIVAGEYGTAPPGRHRLVIGHESLGRVVAAGASDLTVGGLVVAMVREPDPVPCPACAAGEWDRCQNGRFLEHGIEQLDGFACQRWTTSADRLVEVPPSLGSSGVLVEPASVVAKAWEQIDRIVDALRRRPERVLVTGAGPIGLLAALLAVQRGFEVHVLDVVDHGPKPQLVRDLGATYHRSDVAAAGVRADVIVECTGVGQVVVDALGESAPNGLVCLTGLSTGRRRIDLDVGAVNRELVLENDVVVGSVSANRRHYERAVAALSAADPSWLGRLITRHVTLQRWPDAFAQQPADVKVVIDLQ